MRSDSQEILRAGSQLIIESQSQRTPGGSPRLMRQANRHQGGGGGNNQLSRQNLDQARIQSGMTFEPISEHQSEDLYAQSREAGSSKSSYQDDGGSSLMGETLNPARNNRSISFSLNLPRPHPQTPTNFNSES